MIKRNPLVRVQRSIKLSRLKRLKRKPKRVKTLAEISSLREKIRLRKHAEKVHASIATKKQFRKNPLRADSAARREKILS